MNYKETVEAKRQEMVTQLLEFIEKNPAAWQAGWYRIGSTPCNGKTQKNYNGLNALWLYVLSEIKGYGDPRWVTYQQAKELKASVKKGEKAANIFFWSWYDKATKKPYDEETVKDMSLAERQKYLDENVRPVLKYYQVFNADQCNNFPKINGEFSEMSAEERARQNALIENIIGNSEAPISYDGRNNAYYSISDDSIHLPAIERFKTMQDYYATALHEIAHSTGHKSRLNRNLSGNFGKPDYAKEELRAELASVFMQLDYGISIEGKHFENHGAYLQSWLSYVKNDKKEFFTAVTDAEKISQYVGEHYLQKRSESTSEQENTKKENIEETSARRSERDVQTSESRNVENDIYGIIYDWKGLKEENSVYTAAQLKELDEAFVPEERYDGAIAANKTYTAIRLTGQTSEETDQNVREFMTGKYNELGDMPFVNGWYWETVTENFFTGEPNQTTIDYLDRLHIPQEALRMSEEAQRAALQKKIDEIVEGIVKSGTESTTQGNWISSFDEFGEDETFVRENAESISEALKNREEVADVIITNEGIDTNYYTDYCPNIEKNADDYTEPEEVNYMQLVRESVEAEYQDFFAAEMAKPKEELIRDSYVINFYNELHSFLGVDIEDNLTERDLEALHKDSPKILSSLYNYFLSNEYASVNNYSDVAEMIRDYNDKYHAEIVSDRYDTKRQVQQSDIAEQVEQGEQAEQTVKELTPLEKAQEEAEHRALSENIAYVVIEWSESDSSALRDNTVMTFDEADKLLEAMNETEKTKDGYYKTKLHIVAPVESEEGTIAGWYNDCRFDIGSEQDGGLIAHIRGFSEYASDGKEISAFADILESHRQAQKAEKAEKDGQAEQAEQVGQGKKGEWYKIDLTADQIGNEYNNNVMIRLPQSGEYSSFVLFAPKKYIKDGAEKGSKKLSVRNDWDYILQKDGLQVELNGEELRAAFAGQEIGKSAKRVAPRKRNKQRLADLEANVPELMKGLKNWCVFRTKYNPETERQEKFVLSPIDGKWAKSNDPNTWVDFETALKYAEENDCAGLSFALDGKCGITCIDLDKSISKEGKLTESAEKLTQELADTYAETSVSGNGIHIFVADDILHKTYKNRADLPDGEIEVYDNARFISMTGNMRSKSNALTKCPAGTMTWLRSTLGKKSIERENKPRGFDRQSDSEVIERIRRSKKGRDFDILMSGGSIIGDKNKDDLMLLNMLAFFTDCDKSQMESIFLSSGRNITTSADGKRKSGNYLERSIDKACASLKTRISPAAMGGATNGSGRAR